MAEADLSKTPLNRPWQTNILRDGFVVFVTKITGMAAALLVIVLLAKLMPRADLGVFLLVLSLSGFFGICIQFGMGNASLKRVSERLAKGQTQLGAIILPAFTLLAGFGIVFALLWLAGGGRLVFEWLFGLEISGFVLISVVFWAILLAAQKLLSEVFRGMHRLRLASVFDGAGSAVLLALAFVTAWVLRQNIGLDQAMLLAISALGIMVVPALILLIRSLETNDISTQDNAKTLLVLAAPIFMTELMVFFNNQADIWIIAAFLAPEQIASYGVVLRLAMVVLLPGVIINALIAPKIVQLWVQGQHGKLDILLGASAFVALVPTAFMVLAIILLGRPVLLGAFGAEYVAAYPVLVILSLGRLVNIATGSCGQVLILCGFGPAMMLSTICFSMASILIALLLVGDFGITAVAAGFALGMALQNISQYLMVRRWLGVSCLASFRVLKPLLSARFGFVGRAR